jgi:hypothetical protein
MHQSAHPVVDALVRVVRTSNVHLDDAPLAFNTADAIGNLADDAERLRLPRLQQHDLAIFTT